MARCTTCGDNVAPDKRFCGECGAPVESSTSAATRTSFRGAPGAARGAGAGAVRFLPGTVLAGRYRMVGLLGRGGMGEVYRADDLKLRQPVALKFLPAELEREPDRLERFLNEVKVARQVAHPNVCRVYDIAEFDGRHFISMEYVDGEDLASLLRRVGRPPEDRAVQFARQLCAGVAEAHQQGILHRDLKPANVMIDGRGRVRITDFGLAGSADTFQGIDIASGTPAYMAPEQRDGREVTIRSDLYGLGLVLYELFTGQQGFSAKSEQELRASQQTGPPRPSSIIDTLEPAIERVILSCLDPDPGARPSSALAVSAALPGGDPLAAALQAGETPSPEMVAAAGATGGMRPPVAALCLAGILAGLTAMTLTYDGAFLAGQVDLPRPPEALVFDARRVLDETGWQEPPVDRAHGFVFDVDQLAHIRDGDASNPDWDRLLGSGPAPVRFWYRESPRYLVPLDFNNVAVAAEDPQPVVSGMSTVHLDPQGRLLRFSLVPPQLDDSRASAGSPDWARLFEQAGLELEEFTPVPAQWLPPAYCDAREAWTGSHPVGDVPVRVEAAAYKGRAVYFELVFPWTPAGRMAPAPPPAVLNVIGLTILLVLLLGGVLLAHQNLRAGRGDRRGAMRLAIFFFIFNALTSLFGASHVPGIAEARWFFQTLAWGLMTSSMVWLVYIALEPHARRLWPDILISWSRLLGGRFRDPLVGRDILIGGVAGVLIVLINRVPYLAPQWLDLPLKEPAWGPAGGFVTGALFTLDGVRQALAVYSHLPQFALSTTMATVFLLLLLRVILRKPWLAVGATYVIFAAIGMISATNPWIDVTAAALAPALFLFVLIRFGMLSLCALFLVGSADQFGLLTFDPSTWYVGRSLFFLALLATVFVQAFRTSLAPHTRPDSAAG